MIVRSGHMRGKHMHCAIYAPAAGAQPIPIPREMWEQYEADRDLTRGLESRPLKKEGSPLFYLLDEQGNLVFFGPTMMFRLPYPHGVEDFVPAGLRDPGTVDLAEAMFGTVMDGRAIKGRIFCEDARWRDDDKIPFLGCGDGRRSPKILSTPKPTAFPHYLEQPEPDERESLRNWGSDPQETRIRGYKLYWHKRRVEPGDMFEPTLVTGDTQHTVIRPVRNGVEFGGRIRFENLTDLELGALLTVLELPPGKHHRLGMGKPLGLGSVALTVSLHLTDRQQRYQRLFAPGGGLELGERPPAEVDKIRRRAIQTFPATLLEHYRTSGDATRDTADLWSVPRLRALALLLEWEGAPPAAETGYRPAGERPDSLDWWRQHRVLPDPAGVLQGSGSPGGSPRPAAPSASGSALQSGTTVRGEILAETTRKGLRKARLLDRDLVGHILNDPPEPPGVAPGQQVDLVIHSTDPKNLSFRWPRDRNSPGPRGR